MMTKIVGGCLCESVRYSADTEPVLTAICHCRHCQKQTSSAFSIVVAVPKGSLSIEGDGLTTFQDVGDSGQPVSRHFCHHCGSPIMSEVAAMPEVEFIKAGTLDDTSWLNPQMNIWCSTAQPWVVMDEELAKHEKNPPLDA